MYVAVFLFVLKLVAACSDSFDSYAFHVFQMNESLRRNQSDWQERTKRAEVKAAVLEKQKDAEIQDLKVCLCSRYSFTWQVQLGVLVRFFNF